jgi:hypothetical protein
MARHRRMHRRRFSRRGISRRPNRFTIVKGIKLLIALGPVTAKAANAYTANGGGMNGLTKGALPAVTTSYSGYNTNDGKFYFNDMVTGYAPLAAAWAFGKIASRVLRL